MSASLAAYRALTSVAEALATPWALAARRAGGDRAARFGEGDARGATWVHAASVGEVAAAAPLVRALGTHRPGDDRLVSAGTAGGLAAWRRQLERRPSGAAPVAIAAWPLDFPGTVRRAFERRAPRRLLIVETEIWPNALAEAFARGVRVAFASARLSERSWGRTRLLAPMLAPLLTRVTACAAQSEADAARFLALGVPREAIAVTGNTKFDAVIAAPQPGEREAARAAAGLPPEALVVAWGNLRPGEEVAFAGVAAGLAAWARAHARPLALVAVPRHPERAAEIAAAAARAGLALAAWSPGRPWPAAGAATSPVIAWAPALGVLRDVYALADVAIVGGTFASYGGHNAAEPAALGAPVVVGPHHATTADAVRALVARDAGHVARDADDAVGAIARWAATPAALARARGAARLAVDSLAGASARTIGFLEARGFWG